MATVVLTDAKIYLAQFDISGDLNKVTVKQTPALLEDTAFGATYHTNKPGLQKGEVHAEGYTQFGSGVTTIDGRLISKFAVADTPVAVAAEGGDVGEAAYFMKSTMSSLVRGGVSVGELLKFQFDSMCSGAKGAMVRGTIMEDGKTARTTASNTATQTLGAVSATQRMFAQLHLTAFSGTDVTFTVKSAVTDFATITQRAAFTQNTAVGSESLAPVDGAITDTFWRIYWTGTFTSFNAVVLIGIQ